MRVCKSVRERLLMPDVPPSKETVRHLRDCAACARFARNAEAVRDGLRDHHAGVEPDAGFALRVRARLGGQPTELLGWAALRLLPATLAVVLVLAWFASRGTAVGGAVVAGAGPDGDDDVLAWVLAEPGEE